MDEVKLKAGMLSKRFVQSGLQLKTRDSQVKSQIFLIT